MSSRNSQSELDATLVDEPPQTEEGSNHSLVEGSNTNAKSSSDGGSSAEQNDTLPVTSEATRTSSTSGLNTSVGKGRGAMSETTNSRDPFDSRPGGLSDPYPSTSGSAGQGRYRDSYSAQRSAYDRGTEDLMGGPYNNSQNMSSQSYPYGGMSSGPYGMSGQNHSHGSMSGGPYGMSSGMYSDMYGERSDYRYSS